MSSKKATWKEEAKYWKHEHNRLLKRIREIEANTHGHPDGRPGALGALIYSATGARNPSPKEMDRIRDWLRGLREKPKDPGAEG